MANPPLPLRNIIPGLGEKYGLDLAKETMQGPLLVKYAKTVMSLADIKGMYAAPVALAVPTNAGVLALHRAQVTFVADGRAALAGGGDVGIQYDTNSFPGIAALDAADFTTGSFIALVQPIDAVGISSSQLEITNASGAFTGGAPITSMVVELWYSENCGINPPQ